MREIKYRGLNEETGEWVYGWYTKLVEGIRRFDAVIADVGGELTRFYIHNKETIGQYTGLHDKNGKEIYEGDVVFSKDWNPEKQVVTFDRGGFCLKYDGSGYYPDIKYAEQMTVIGNIHESK